MSEPRRTIAIIGASADRRKFGNKAVRAYLQRGYTVFPVNPHETTIEELTVYRSVGDVPVAELDRISLYVPPDVGRSLVPDLVTKPTREIWLNPGAESGELLDDLKAHGLHVIEACSIVDIGVSPHSLSDV